MRSMALAALVLNFGLLAALPAAAAPRPSDSLVDDTMQVVVAVMNRNKAQFNARGARFLGVGCLKILSNRNLPTAKSLCHHFGFINGNAPETILLELREVKKEALNKAISISWAPVRRCSEYE